MYSVKTLSEDDIIIPMSLVQSYLRVDNQSEDYILFICMKRAEEYLQKQFKVVISGKTQQIVTDEIQFGCIKTQYRPLQEIKSIKVGDKTLDQSEYQQEEDVIKILTQDTGKFELVVKFGYSDTTTIPGTIQSIFLQLVLHFYQNKDGTDNNVPVGILEASRHCSRVKV